MNGMVSSTDDSAAQTNDAWISVFQQRGVWDLTREFVDRWVIRNHVFFDMVQRFVPHGGRILEIGCGPGRHALGSATLGFRMVGIDVDPRIIAQAQANAHVVAPESNAVFQLGDIFNLGTIAAAGPFQAITHGGLMEHLDSAESIRDVLRSQLDVAPTVIFDVPFDSQKNRRLFERDDIFRQLWTPDQWLHGVLAGLPILESGVDLHPEPNMTDDLVVALRF